MPVISFLSQKGGVGKSTLARALAREAAAGDIDVLVADLDPHQQTSTLWADRRAQAGITPAVPVRDFDDAQAALAAATGVDVLIIDGPARASAETLQIAQGSDLVVHPASSAIDDLYPAVMLFHELALKGIPKTRLAVALCRLGTEAEEVEARAYVTAAGYDVLPGALLERPAYRQAQNSGQAVTEVRFSGLSQRADALVQAIIDRVS